MRYRLRTLMIAVVALALALAVFRAIEPRVHIAHARIVKGTFTKLPPDDIELTLWIQKQPGVGNAFVHRPRPGTVYVGWVYSKTVLQSEPPWPDVDREMTRLGYKVDANGLHCSPTRMFNR